MIEWKDAYSTGDEAIDRQHRLLFGDYARRVHVTCRLQTQFTTTDAASPYVSIMCGTLLTRNPRRGGCNYRAVGKV